MSVILILYFGVFYRTILYISFDEVFARTYSSYVDIFKYITTSLIALTIVLNIRMAGVVLVISLLTIPPNIAMLFTKTYFKIVIWSILAGFVGTSRDPGWSHHNFYSGNNMGSGKRHISFNKENIKLKRQAL
jgi:zinc transport system permease protein